MTEQDHKPTDTGKTAGAMLREARVAQGLHIAVMAASIKVAQRKLESLEGDRYDELPDATFTRALAQTMCRVLKIDPEPVLARLPSVKTPGLEHVSIGLNTPFRERPGRSEPRDWSLLASPVVWGTAVLIIAAVAVVLLPQKWLPHQSAESSSNTTTATTTTPTTTPTPTPTPTTAPVPAIVPEPSPPAPSAAAVANTSAAVANTVPATVSPVVAATAPPAASLPAAALQTSAASAPAASGGANGDVAKTTTGALQLRTSAASWIQVTDGNGRVLLARTLEPGETLGLDGAAPLRVRVGNAAGTQISYRGQPVALVAARDNTAKVELK